MKSFLSRSVTRFAALLTLLFVLVPSILIAVQVNPLAGFFAANAIASAVGATQRLGALNASSSLKLDVIMRKAMRALKKRLSPVLALSTVMRDIELTETNTVQVPFYPLETLVSKDFDGSYSFAGGDANLNSKAVTVNKRKYQPLQFTSKELARNSVVDLNQVMMLKVEKLAEDVLNDIFSVVTVANYGAAILTSLASAFDRFDVADLRTALTELNWPAAGRALLLESAYEGALVKDQMNVLTTGTDAALREGAVGRLANFDIFDHPNMPTNGENLVGACVLPYGICAAFSPIQPAEEVMHQLSEYRRYVDADTKLTLEYRSWGDPNSDTVNRVMEVSYGYALGDPAQLKRIVSA